MAFMLWVVSGLGFLVGALAFAVAGAAGRRRTATGRLLQRLGLLLSVALLWLSATPLPTWLSAAGLIVAIQAIVLAGPVEARLAREMRIAYRALPALWCVTAVAVEMRWYIIPSLPPGRLDQVYVIGDSLSAGVGNGVECWPQRIQHSHRVSVTSYAQAGATTAEARMQTEKLSDTPGVVVVLIGGNDLLHGRPVADFERDLDAVLRRSCGGGNRVVMLELPLWPWTTDFGRAQRRVAAAHGVPLIPKRRLASIVATSTFDGLHLNDAGQEALAKTVWDAIRPATAGYDDSADYGD